MGACNAFPKTLSLFQYPYGGLLFLAAFQVRLKMGAPAVTAT